MKETMPVGVERTCQHKGRRGRRQREHEREGATWGPREGVVSG